MAEQKHRHEKGFTLIEMMVVLTIMSIMALIGISQLTQERDDIRTSVANQEISQILQAAVTFRSANGEWPDDVQELIDDNWVPPGAAEGPWGGAYQGSEQVDPDGASIWRVEYAAPEDRFAQIIAGRLPFGEAIGSTIRAHIVLPGHEAAHDALYARDGSRPLTGDMPADGNSIEDVDDLEVDSLTPRSGSWITVADDGLEARRMRDPDDPSMRIDFSDWSRLQNLEAVEQIRAPIFVDSDDPSWFIDPSGSQGGSRITIDEARDAHTGRWFDEGLVNVGITQHGEDIPKPTCRPDAEPQVFTAAMATYSGDFEQYPLGAIITHAPSWEARHEVVTKDGTHAAGDGSRVLFITRCARN